MSTLHEKKFIFITGVEGSGTTMLLKFLSAPRFSIALGGNFFSPGYKAQFDTINAITDFIWGISSEKDPKEVKEKKEIIRNIEIPEKVSHIIYKRSFPFTNLSLFSFTNPIGFPNLPDLFDFAPSSKILVIKRDLKACATSSVRRGISKAIKEAAERTKKGMLRLTSELKKLNKNSYKIILYEDFIKNPGAYKNELETFLDFPEGSLKKYKRYVRRPTLHSYIELKKHRNFLEQFFASYNC